MSRYNGAQYKGIKAVFTKLSHGYVRINVYKGYMITGLGSFFLRSEEIAGFEDLNPLEIHFRT